MGRNKYSDLLDERPYNRVDLLMLQNISENVKRILDNTHYYAEVLDRAIAFIEENLETLDDGEEVQHRVRPGSDNHPQRKP